METVDNIIKASLCLHNFIIKDELQKSVNKPRNVFTRMFDESNECEAMRDITYIDTNERTSHNAVTIRNKFVDYFMNEGAVF